MITLDSTEYYDEGSGSWRLGHPLPAPMRTITAIPKSGTEVLLFGGMILPTGQDEDTNDKLNSKLVLFDVSTGN